MRWKFFNVVRYQVVKAQVKKFMSNGGFLKTDAYIRYTVDFYGPGIRTLQL